MDYQLCHSVVTSFEQEKSAVLDEEYYDACYVLACKVSPDQSTMASILSNNTVDVYDTGVGSTQSLRARGSIPNAHQGRVNDIAMLPQHPDGSVFITAGLDGRIRTWDLRESTMQPKAERILDKQQGSVTSIDVGCGGMLLAAGTEANPGINSKVLFWDVRSSNLLGSYGISHSDVITQVCFSPTNNNHLATASLDGLVCWFNVTRAGEEDALESVLNCNSAVSRIGFFGPGDQCLYSLTHTETFSMWHVDKAHRMAEFPMLRQHLGSLGARADYLVDCCYWERPDGSDQQLVLMSGAFDGRLSLSRVAIDGITPIGQMSAPSLSGHQAVVRCAAFVQPDAATGTPSRVLTGAEDAQICEWISSQADPARVPSPTEPAKLVASGASADGEPMVRAARTRAKDANSVLLGSRKNGASRTSKQNRAAPY